MEKKKIKFLLSKISIILPIALVTFYQYAISPLVGNNCRFSPTCSKYSKDAFVKFGLLYGLLYSLKRVIRCHPWGSFGYDPLDNHPVDKTT